MMVEATVSWLFRLRLVKTLPCRRFAARAEHATPQDRLLVRSYFMPTRSQIPTSKLVANMTLQVRRSISTPVF